MRKSKRRRLVIRLALMALCLLLPCCAFASDAEDVLYVVNPVPQDRLNLRSEDTIESPSLGKYYTGTVGEVLGATETFTRVRIGNLTGYMQTSYLSERRVDMELGIWGTVRVTNLNDKLNLRTSTEEGAGSLGLFPTGTAVQILEDAGDFYKVRTLDYDGFMHKAYLQLDGQVGKVQVTQLTEGVVLRDDMGMWAFPSKDAPLLMNIKEGSHVDILGTTGVWYYVELTNPGLSPLQQQRGFVLGQNLQVGNFGGEATEGHVAVVCNEDENVWLHLRAEAAWSSESIGQCVNNTQVIVLDDVGDENAARSAWWHVQVSDQQGYMQSQYLQLVATESLAIEEENLAPEIENAQQEAEPEEEPVEGETSLEFG